MDFFSAETITALMGVILVNLVLSGDNAVVIGMAACRLHGRQRTLAIIFGGAAAVVLRIIFTVIAAYLLGIPLLQFLGGVLLIWIAYKLLIDTTGDSTEHKSASSMLEALWIITVADLVMSLDNVLAIAALARDSIGLLIVGLIMSMAIVLFAGSICAMLMEKYPWINYIGSIAIAYVAGEMIMKDQAIHNLAPQVMSALEHAAFGIEIAIVPTVLAIAVPVVTTMIRRSREKAEAPAQAMTHVE